MTPVKFRTPTRGIAVLVMATKGLVLLLVTTALFLACGDSVAGEPPEKRFEFSTADDAIVLHYEGTSFMVLGRQPTIELTIYGSGRVVGRRPAREAEEWFFSHEEIVELLDQLDATGAFGLTTEKIAAAHEARRNEGGYVDDGGRTTLRVFLHGYRPRQSEGLAPVRPLALELSYENASAYARMLPQVEELGQYVQALKLVDGVLRRGAGEE